MSDIQRESRRVMGVDACKKGWIGITDDAHAYFAATIDQLVAAAKADGEIAVVAIDIPIGLPTATTREADRLVRGLIGKRASSVFPTAVRAALLAPTHAEATAINLAVTGKGISRQTYGLAVKILQVDGWLVTTDLDVIEVHPELSFRTIAGHPLFHPKSTWAGFAERRRLLDVGGIALPPDVDDAGANAAVDDVLDAAAALWTGMRFADGRAVSYPSVPERFADGTTAAIWV